MKSAEIENYSKKNSELSKDKQPLKMKALMEASDTTKATILHYVKHQLIPQPVKPGRNQALYDPSSVKLIKTIKSLQSRYRLSLAEIKDILKEQDIEGDVLPFIEMKEMIFGKQSSNLMNQKEFCAKSGLSDEVVKKCIEADVLLPKKKGKFNSTDLAIAKILRTGFKFGLSLEDYLYYPRLAKEMVEAEMSIHSRLTKNKSFSEAVLITMNIITDARAMRSYITERIFQREVAGKKEFNTKKE